jgi:uncharacterized OsmC-like protein
MAGETDAIRELADDHRHVEDIFRQIEALPEADHICKIYTDRATIERVHGFHANYCPVARSIRDAIDISTDYELVAATAGP